MLKFNIMRKETESEKVLEARLVSEIRRRKGIALKLTSQFHRGMPDRLVILPYHTIVFVEMKSTGKKPTALQEKAMAELRTMRFSTRVVDSTEALDDLMRDLDERLTEQKRMSDEIQERQKAVRAQFLMEQKSHRREEK